jgi:micrococcal nuclease
LIRLRFPGRRTPIWALLIPIVLALVLARFPELREFIHFPSSKPVATTREASGWRTVVHVIDGDTVRLDGGETVRLIGVDAPETAQSPRAQRLGQDDPYAHEATQSLRHLIHGQQVRLVHDGRLHDRYGRTLAYVYLEDGTLVNAELIREGYACAYRNLSYDFRDKFLRLEAEARLDGRGLWAQEKHSSLAPEQDEAYATPSR